MGVGAACNNFPVACYLKFLQRGGCNKCCKLNGFVRDECRGRPGWDCWCCRE
ncbi:hypothetical protein HU200_002021 [Digitaria exilis]|uniref:Uncharacterized protein n=1 Tax=Digitaria exilis TaxID=1010633 RepID=A0A835BWE6_9POAL|nr:hypothetical protein HU200_028288 [Digitaria exilis]KAF8780009.1 hypothetical protein HU200_002021 [Digitaria exilis]